MSTYTLNIKNESGVPKTYLLFQDVPQPTSGPTGPVFMNVYQKTPIVQSGPLSNAQFSMTDQFYAIYGTSTTSNNQVRIDTSNSEPIKLGPNGSYVGLQVDANGDPSFDPSLSSLSTSDAGAFTYQTDQFVFPNKYNTYIGIGAVDPKDSTNILPIQTYEAEPALTTKLWPKVVYYVATGESDPGTVVDRQAYSFVLKVDFTSAAIGEAYFIQKDDASFVDDNGKSAANGVTFTWAPLPQSG